MYKNWEVQKKALFEIIAKGQSATVQVVSGTNYSIFFRNIHSDLLLKKSILPVYVDLNHLIAKDTKSINRLVMNAFKRALIEKRLYSKSESEPTSDEEVKEKINHFLKEASSRNLTAVVFFEDVDAITDLGIDAFSYQERLIRRGEKCSFIYLVKTNMSHPDNVHIFGKAPHIYENVLYLPIKDEKYLKSIESGTSVQTFKKIYALTGGVDSFFSVAMDLKNNIAPKQRKNIAKHINENWHLKKEVHKLWDSLSFSEVKILSYIVWGVKEFEYSLSYDINHLLNLGLIEKAKDGYKIVIGLLKNVGVEKSQKQRLIVEFNRDRVVVNGTNIALKLTIAEKKLLRQLLTNKNKIVARGEIAKAVNVPKKSDKDTLIDSTVSKLKSKLSEVWINPNNLIQVEGKGFIYREL